MQILPLDKNGLEKAKESLPEEKLFIVVVELFKALGDSTRATILYSLQKVSLSVRDIAIIAGISESATSHQLSYLKEKQLIKVKRSGTIMNYSISYQHLRNLLKEAEYYGDHVLGQHPDHPEKNI